MTTERILVVCSGNICRSAFAEMLLRDRLRPIVGGDVQVSSAGTTAVVGAPVESLAAEQLERRGIASSPFSARQISVEMLLEADLVLAMTRAHRALLLDMAPSALRWTFTFREFVAFLEQGPPTLPHRLGEIVPAAYCARTSLHTIVNSRSADVDDPFGGTEADFAHMARVLDAGAQTITRALNASTTGGAAATRG